MVPRGCPSRLGASACIRSALTNEMWEKHNNISTCGRQGLNKEIWLFVDVSSDVGFFCEYFVKFRDCTTGRGIVDNEDWWRGVLQWASLWNLWSMCLGSAKFMDAGRGAVLRRKTENASGRPGRSLVRQCDQRGGMRALVEGAQPARHMSL